MMEGCSAPARLRDFGAPVIAVCGFSGSGKTTLIEAAISHLVAQKLSIAVVKHDAHGFTVDQPGKDSDRFFRVGATTALRGPSEQFHRRGGSACLSLEATVAQLARDHDLVLVEGHKNTDLPKIWLSDDQDSLPPDDVTEVMGVLSRSERLASFLSFLESWLPQSWNARPLFAGLLIGGKSSRMGSPKQLLEFGGRPLGEIVATALCDALHDGLSASKTSDPLVAPSVAILGSGPVSSPLQNLTRLPDPPELSGPIAGLLAAHRWNPRAAWILAITRASPRPTLNFLWTGAGREPGR